MKEEGKPMRKKSRATKMVMRVFIIFLFSLLWSCMNFQYFDLFIEPSPHDSLKTINCVLGIEDIHSNDILLDQRMVFRKNAYQVGYLPFKQWVKRTEDVVQDTVYQYFKNSSFFAKVVNEHSSVEPDWKMRMYVDSLEIVQEGRSWYARLAMDIEWSDAKSEKTLLTHSFDRKMSIARKDPRLVPEKISSILKEELQKMLQELKKIKPAQ